MRFRQATDDDEAAWQALLATCESGDFLHDWAWAHVAAFDGQPMRRYLLEEDGAVTALVAAQARSLLAGRQFWYVPHGPVLDYTHPLAPDRVRALLRGMRHAARDHRAIAVKLEPRLEPGGPSASVLGGGTGLRATHGTLQVGQTRLVPLIDDEELLASFDKDTRYAVRRAEREGVSVSVVDDPRDDGAVDELHALVRETQRRAGFPMPPLARYRTVWRALAGGGRAALLEARHDGVLLASGIVVFEGERSFYLFSGSLREAPGEPKRYASYALQWAMMRLARERGCTVHDLWGVAPPGAGPEHRWHGVGLFKKGFGGREVVWADSSDLVVDPTLYRMRRAVGTLRGWLRGIRR